MLNNPELERALTNVELLRRAVCYLLDANVKLLAVVGTGQGDAPEEFTTRPSIGSIRADLLDARDALFRYNGKERAGNSVDRGMIG